MKILTAAQIAEVDKLTTERYFIPSLLLMENAGRSFTDELAKACPGLYGKRIAVFCGKGNNGGDGFVVARHLALRGAVPSIFLLADPKNLKGDALTNYRIDQAIGLPIQALSAAESVRTHLKKAGDFDVIVDALFGTGLTKAVGPDYRYAVEWINKSSAHAFVASVDIPSGLMADASEIPGPAVKARLTVTFSALKLAHVMPPASDFAGNVIVVPIGSPAALFENPGFRTNVTDPLQVRQSLPKRARDSHKGSFGHVYVVAGSRGKSGAALMTGLAALRSGSGLVTLWLPESLQGSVAGRFPELMTEFLPETKEGSLDETGAERVIAQLPQADALAIGPGLTTHPSTRRLVWKLVRRSPVPVVLDADGINAYVPPAEPLQNGENQPIIITPHPGEMARLIGEKTADVQKSRLKTAESFAAAHQCYVVLKGFQTVIATPKRDLFINLTGNPGMATGGTGDILAGMTARFVAGWMIRHGREPGADLADFLSAAVYLHGSAGDLAAEAEGMEPLIATDLLVHLPRAIERAWAS